MTEQVDTGGEQRRGEYSVKDIPWLVSDMFNSLGLRTSLPNEWSTLGTGYERARAYWRLRGGRKIGEKLGLKVRLTLQEKERLQSLREFDRQFLHPERLEVSVGELGVQSAEFVRVRIEKIAGKPENSDKPPVYLVPAFSGDRYGVLSLVRELSLAGYTVYCLDYPESHSGRTTDEFADGVQRSLQDLRSERQMEPHTSWFKAGLAEAAGREGSRKFMVMGYSAGGPIVRELAVDPDLVGKVEAWVALSPASCVEQTVGELTRGFWGEIRPWLMTGKFYADQGVVLGPRGEAAEQEKRRRGDMKDAKKGIKSISGALALKVCAVSGAWEKALADPQARFIVQSGSGDGFTKTGEALGLLGSSPGTTVLDWRGWTHLSPLLEARKLVEMIEKIRIEDKKKRYFRI